MLEQVELEDWAKAVVLSTAVVPAQTLVSLRIVASVSFLYAFWKTRIQYAGKLGSEIKSLEQVPGHPDVLLCCATFVGRYEKANLMCLPVVGQPDLPVLVMYTVYVLRYVVISAPTQQPHPNNLREAASAINICNNFTVNLPRIQDTGQRATIKNAALRAKLMLSYPPQLN